MPNKMPIGTLAAIVCLIPATSAMSDAVRTLSKHVGYTIVASKYIKGWVSEDGEKHGDSFEGCEYGRKIIFDDGKYLICSGYSYRYAYHPEAVILSNGSNWVMVVDDDEYDMR